MPGEWKAGDQIQGRWQVDRVLKGGIGVVYVLLDWQFMEVFAAKTFQDEVFERNPETAKRFTQEASTWINLEAHENVARARFVEVIQGKPFLFLEFVSGGDLSKLIGTPRLLGNELEILKYAIQFCDGMHHALSKGVSAHRDIKPQNCLVTEDGVLKVTDFGLAKVVTDLQQEARAAGAGMSSGSIFGSNTGQVPLPKPGLFSRLFSSGVQPSPIVPASIDVSKTGLAAGTCTHMAPEQFADSKHVDVRADVYSFGVMLFQMVQGHLPFNARTWQEYERLHRFEAPPPARSRSSALDNVIERCLAKNPDGRPSNFDVIREMLSDDFQRIAGKRPPAPKRGSDLTAVEIYNKAMSLAALNKHEQAIAVFDACLATASTQSEVFEHALVNKGIALHSIGRYDEAISNYDRALELAARVKHFETPGMGIY